MKIVTLMNDTDSENPCKFGGWKLHSFSSRHSSFTSPDEFFPLSIGLRRKLETGTAFILSYSEHGSCQWYLKTAGSPSDPFDTVGVAGILVWNEKVKDLPKGFEARKKFAASFCETYTSWCNGEVYGFQVEEVVTLPCGHTETKDGDSCFGFFEAESMAEEVRASVNGDKVEFRGEAAWLADHYDFRGSTATV